MLRYVMLLATKETPPRCYEQTSILALPKLLSRFCDATRSGVFKLDGTLGDNYQTSSNSGEQSLALIFNRQEITFYGMRFIGK